MPGMVLSPVPKSPMEPPGVTVDVVDEAGVDEWRHVLTDSWLPTEVAEQLFPTSLGTDPDVRLFTARLDGRPVGASVAIRTGDVSGVYGVVTVPTARRRGVGTAATWAAVGAGRSWGCGTISLQASEMGYSSYRKMGFRTVLCYTTFSTARQT